MAGRDDKVVRKKVFEAKAEEAVDFSLRIRVNATKSMEIVVEGGELTMYEVTDVVVEDAGFKKRKKRK